jgi:glycine C-acetyltransferase
MYGTVRDDLVGTLAEVREAGLYKSELEITTPQGAHVDVTGRGELLNLCANNYLGLANHPAIVEAAHDALDRWGYGMASVRFICGTQALHRELEERLSEFLGTDDTILYSSCFDANGGLFEALLDENDAVISDQLNHASIIDGIRLCKARRLRYANGDMDELEARLEEAGDARRRLIATDGVFSMDGYLAQLDRICELAERHGALVMVDDSHAVGVVGPGGRGTPEHHDVVERVDILTGTLGKAIGGASGGYVSGRREIVELLRQRSRPYLFSNSVAPPVVGASIRALELLETSAGSASGKATGAQQNPGGELRDRLRENTAHFRGRMTELGFDVLPGEHPIVPVMIGDEVTAAAFSARLVELGVYAVSFSYPVVPRGTARIRTQMSAAHSVADLDFAAEQFAAARSE